MRDELLEARGGFEACEGLQNKGFAVEVERLDDRAFGGLYLPHAGPARKSGLADETARKSEFGWRSLPCRLSADEPGEETGQQVLHQIEFRFGRSARNFIGKRMYRWPIDIGETGDKRFEAALQIKTTGGLKAQHPPHTAACEPLVPESFSPSIRLATV